MKLAMMLLLLIVINSIAFSLYELRQDKLDKIYQEAWQQKALEKYQWKSDRLKMYTDLVYNVNGGAIYEK